MEMIDAKDFFTNNSYVVVKNFISKEIANMLYAYSITVVQSIDFKIMHDRANYNEEWDGIFGDIQVPGTFQKYADPMMDTLLINFTQSVEEFTGLELKPTYSYWRLYQKDNLLARHVDRDSCEISLTLCLGYNHTNVDKIVYPNYNWPMFVETKDRSQGLPISLTPGDAIIYRGCDIEHWRDKFLGLNHSQLFLHYADTTGDAKHVYDGRPMVGIPGKFKKFK